MTREETEMAVQRVAVILSGQPSICAASADGAAVDLMFREGTKLRLLAVAAEEPPARQVVYRYPAGESGSGEFAVWHTGTAVVTFCRPEGQVIAVVPLDAADRDHADRAAAAHGEIWHVSESSSLYPQDSQ